MMYHRPHHPAQRQHDDIARIKIHGRLARTEANNTLRITIGHSTSWRYSARLRILPPSFPDPSREGSGAADSGAAGQGW